MTRPPRFRPDRSFVLRTPLLAVDELAAWGAGSGPSDADAAVAAQRAYLAALLARPEVEEAVALASPGLHAELPTWRDAPDGERGRRVERALVKYVARMATRATPFGLFAGVSSGALAAPRAPERLALGAPRDHRRRTRVDNDVLFQLAQRLARDPAARARLTWRPNTSLVEVAGRLRYAEARAGAGRGLSYHLVSAEPTPYLRATLARARAGARAAELAAALVADDPEVTLDEASAYVDELLDAQLLVPDLGVTVTGPEPVDAMIAQARGAGLDDVAAALTAARDAIAAIDADGPGAAPARYAPVREALEALFAPGPDETPATAEGAAPQAEAGGDAAPARAHLDPSRLFQVDLAPAADATLGADVATEIARAVEVLRRLTPTRDDAGLAAFRRAFNERWEGREIPLAEALDEEAGIGFEAATGPGSEGSPLLAGLPFPGAPAEPRGGWSRREAWLLARLTRAIADGEEEIVLSDDDVAAMAAPDAARLPDAFAVMASFGRDPATGALALLVDGASGPSGANLLGRFCHLDAGVHAHVRAHLAAEEALRPEVTFAEVVHLAEGRNGNILCRPVIRDHEIVYLGLGGAEPARQLPLDDLRVSVRGDRIVLRSTRLGRPVVPRLSSAHNVRAFGLGVYRFLHALGAQDGQSVGWSWGALGDAPRLPRVRHGKVVLARASWTVRKPDLDELAKAIKGGGAAARARGLAAMAALRARLGLPRHVVLLDGDNELYADLDHALLTDALVDELAGRGGAQLAEVYPAPAHAPVTGPGGRHACEIVVTFVREPDAPAKPTKAPASSKAALASAPVAPDVAAAPLPAPRPTRRFAPGSRWLYAKLYGGVSSADRALREAVAPVVRDALASGAARRWFFIRYADPHPHVRLRLDGDPARLGGEVLGALHDAAAPLLDDGALWRVQLDTYEPEIDRYGGPAAIELAEDVFWRDSEACLTIVEHLDGDAGADARWQLALRSSDDLLAALGLDADARAAVFAAAKTSMDAEFRASTPLHQAIGERYRARQADLDALLAPGAAADPDHPLAPGLAALATRDAALAPTAAALRALDAAGGMRPPLAEIAWSLVHMTCNRLLHASARAQELVIYDLLKRHHARRRALAARAAAAPAP